MTFETQNGGGAAAQSGFSFQNRVAAWICARILAEKEASPLWDLDNLSTFEFIRFETEQPVDDLMVGTSSDGFCFLNIKLRISSLGAKDFREVIHQFVRQYWASSNAEKNREWNRPLDPETDRLILATSAGSSFTLRQTLRGVLEKLRLLSKPGDLTALAHTFSNKEQEAFKALRYRIREAWALTTTCQLDVSREFELLRLIRIVVFNLDSTGTDEISATDLLRSTVLDDPEQASLVWSHLVDLCANQSKLRNGLDRKSIRRHLEIAGVSLKTTKTYRNDVEILRRHSSRTRKLLEDLSVIRVGNRDISIKRQSTDALYSAAIKNSILVVGDPGSGKSGALFEVVRKALSNHLDVIYLAVDHLDTKSLADLNRELGLEHELEEVLLNWNGNKPGLLVIDALDAARSESTAKAIFDLISVVVEDSSRWRVIASIRRFDLRHHEKLRNRFRGKPPEPQYVAPEFNGISHFCIPTLSNEEFAEIERVAPELKQLISSSNESLVAQLRIPFNLRLAGQLLEQVSPTGGLASVTAQIELLEQFWQLRVVGTDGKGNFREAVLLSIVDDMITSGSLRARRLSLSKTPDVSVAINELLSSKVISDWESAEGKKPHDFIVFSHHVLFDYAVARLKLRISDKEIVDLITNQPDLLLVIRPSFVLNLQELWHNSPQDFWKRYLKITDAEAIPLIGKSLGASVIAESITKVEQFDPLVKALTSQEVRQRKAARAAFRQVTSSLLVSGDQSPKFRLIGSSAELWCRILDTCTDPLDRDLASSIKPLLWVLSNEVATMTEAQLHHFGRTARRFLKFSIDDPRRVGSLVSVGIAAVSKSIASNISESSELLRLILQPDRVRLYGHEELFPFSLELPALSAVVPNLVEEAFLVAFTIEETSEEKTNNLSTPILSLTSTKRQDFRQARFGFVRSFERFCQVAPVNAARVVVGSISTYLNQKFTTLEIGAFDSTSDENLTATKTKSEPFEFNEHLTGIVQDHSAIWDDSIGAANDQPLELLSIFEQYLAKSAAGGEIPEEIQTCLNFLIGQPRPAVIWKRLLMLGERNPGTFGHYLRSLAWAIPILACKDTTYSAGNFIAANYNQLTDKEKKKVEKTILSLPSCYPKEVSEWTLYVRNRLIGVLANFELVTSEGSAILQEIKEKGIPPNDPLYSSAVWTSEYTDKDFLRGHGVSLDDERSRVIFDLTSRVKEFIARFPTSALPSKQDAREGFEILHTLYTALRDNEQAISAVQSKMAWSYIASVCIILSRLDGFESNDDALFLRSLIMECSRHEDPEFCSQQEEQFNDHPSWSPACRIEAAEALVGFSKHKNYFDDEVSDTLEVLATKDSVAAVRFQIVTRLVDLYTHAPELMWRLISAVTDSEESIGILEFFTRGPLHRLAIHHSELVEKLTFRIWERVRDDRNAGKLRKNCCSIIFGLSLFRNLKLSSSEIEKIIADPVLYPDEADQIVRDSRDYFKFGIDDLLNVDKALVRRRSFRVVQTLIASIRDATDQLRIKYETLEFENWPSDDKSNAKTLASLADLIGSQIYFSSGAYGSKQNQTNENASQMNATAKAAFLEDAGPILDILCGFGYPHLTYYILETLEFFVPISPTDIFRTIGAAITAGRHSGFQNDRLGSELAVRLIERYLAEYRYIFMDEVECRRILIEVLDVFIEAGWPEAQQLTYRLEEIYR